MGEADATGDVLHRNPPGTKAADMFSWPDQPLTDMEGTFSVQQYIQQCIRKDPSDVESILECPEARVVCF